MKKILVGGWIPEEVLNDLRDEFIFEIPSDPNTDMTQKEAEELIKGCDGLLSVKLSVDRALIDAADKLEAIATNSVGFDHIDVAYANSKNITVINTPYEVLDPTAELSLALILDVYRGISFYDRRTRSSANSSLPGLSSDLIHFAKRPAGKTLGIVGFGRIGREVARKAKAALGMDIIYYNPSRAPESVERELDARKVSFEDLLILSDCISVHCPYNADSHHLFSDEQFDKMKDSAYFVNIARGKVMDEGALIRALKEHKIAGAALDVYENEPDVSKELCEMDNVVLAPHIGTYTYESRTAMLREALAGLTAVLRGETTENIVKLKK